MLIFSNRSFILFALKFFFLMRTKTPLSLRWCLTLLGISYAIHSKCYSCLNSLKLVPSPRLVAKTGKVKLATIVEGNPKAPFSIATTPRCRGGRYSFPGWLYFTLDPHLIMLSVKQGGIKYHFLSLWYDSTWD